MSSKCHLVNGLNGKYQTLVTSSRKRIFVTVRIKYNTLQMNRSQNVCHDFDETTKKTKTYPFDCVQQGNKVDEQAPALTHTHK